MGDDPGAMLHFGSGAWRTGQEVVLPSLADTLWAYAAGGAEVFRDGPLGRAVIASGHAWGARMDEDDQEEKSHRLLKCAQLSLR